jgi:signal transduction histidine kinase
LKYLKLFWNAELNEKLNPIAEKVFLFIGFVFFFLQIPDASKLENFIWATTALTILNIMHIMMFFLVYKCPARYIIVTLKHLIIALFRPIIYVYIFLGYLFKLHIYEFTVTGDKVCSIGLILWYLLNIALYFMELLEVKKQKERMNVNEKM